MEAKRYRIEIVPEFVGKRVLKRFRLPPSLNDRLHHMARYRVGEQFKHQAFLACKEAKIPHMKSVRLEVQDNAIRPRDRDNLMASLKPIVDGIVLAGVVPDDAEGYVELAPLPSVIVKTRKDEKLVIHILSL